MAQAPADSAAAPADTAKTAPSQPAKPAEVKTPAVLYEKAKLEVDGSIDFLFVPAGGKAVPFSVAVLKESNKEDIAKAIHTPLTIAAGEQYKVKVSGKEIKIEKAKKEFPNFSVTIEKVTLPGVTVLVKKD
jgi:nucleosome binding factor SPN SPT16 subunit